MDSSGALAPKMYSTNDNANPLMEPLTGTSGMNLFHGVNAKTAITQIITMAIDH